MKPLYDNYIETEKWYGKVNCENHTQVRDYCNRRGYSTDYYFLVDFSIPSGKKRFFLYDLQQGKQVMGSYCMHGSEYVIQMPNRSSATSLVANARALADM